MLKQRRSSRRSLHTTDAGVVIQSERLRNRLDRIADHYQLLEQQLADLEERLPEERFSKEKLAAAASEQREFLHKGT